MKITVRDVMTNALVTVQPTTGFRAMAARLREGGFSALPVVDAEGKLVGLVSEADLLVKTERGSEESVAHPSMRQREIHAKRSGTVAYQVMSRPVVTVDAGASISETAQLMHRYGLKRLLVIDDAGRPVGLVSRGDLLKVFLRSDDEIKQDVRAELTASGLNAGGGAVKVAVQGGVVILEGHPTSTALMRQLTDIALGVDGVVGVTWHPGTSPKS